MIVLRGLGVCCIYESSNTDKKTASCLAVTVREEDNGLHFANLCGFFVQLCVIALAYSDSKRNNEN